MWNGLRMDSAVAGYGGADAEVERPIEGGWNWGLIVAFGSCLLFWLVVVLGLTGAF